MIKNVRHIGIVVNDLELTETFWTDVLEFEIKSKQIEEGVFIDKLLCGEKLSLTTVKLFKNSGAQIELIKYNNICVEENWKGSQFKTGLTHVALEVNDIKKLHDKLQNKGYRFFNPPQLSPDGKAIVAYCIAVENLLLELVELV